MLLALMVTRTVNLNKLACAFLSDKEQASRFRRLQRFFAQFKMDYDWIAEFIFRTFFADHGRWYLTMDRTHWQWGKSDINILTLGIVFKGAAIPLYWILLDKRGNSDTAERIELREKFIKKFGKQSIAGLLADREFIGKERFNGLLTEKTPFYIKSNTVTTNARGYEVDIDALFYGLKPGEQRIISGKRKSLGS